MSSDKRRRFVGGIARSHEELEQLDLDFWERATGSDRLEAVWQLAQDAMVISPEEPGQSAFGIRKGRSV